jgi:acetyl esterase/lipase
MSTYDLLDPQVAAVLAKLPELRLTNDSEALDAIRDAHFANLTLVEPEDYQVTREEIYVPGLEEIFPPVRCLKYTPSKENHSGAGYLHIHGGGYILGTPEMMDASNAFYAAKLGITILSVDYRLAPEHPAPAALDDCHAALAWLHQNANELGLDTTRIGIGGESAGGGLAAALSLRARDINALPICFQLLTYPMLDDRTGSADNPADPLTGEFMWTRKNNTFAWASYLGESLPSAPQVPARAETLKGLPSTWLGTASLDLFRDENIKYAQRLMASGVTTELAVYPGTCHGFQLAVDAEVTKRFLRDATEALRKGLGC